MKIFIFGFLKQPFLICVLTIKTFINYFIVGTHTKKKKEECCNTISRFRIKCIVGNVFRKRTPIHCTLWLAYNLNPPSFGGTGWYFCITVLFKFVIDFAFQPLIRASLTSRMMTKRMLLYHKHCIFDKVLKMWWKIIAFTL